MQQIYLNIIPNGICPRVYVNQYDVGRGIQIKFKDGSANYGFASGTTFKVNGRKSDGHVFEYTEADKWDATNYIILKSMPPGGATTVYLYTTEQMTAASGEVLMQLTYKLDNAVQGTLNFIMVVQERPEATGDPSESDVPGVVRLVNEVAPDADGEVILKWKDQSSVSNLSITENTRIMSTTRNADTYVYVKADDQLYVITSTISSGGTLSPGTNAAATSVGAALATLNSHLASVDSDLAERVKCKTLLKGLSTAGWYTFATFPSNGSDIGEAVEITISSQYNNASNFVASALLLRAFLVSSLTLRGMLARTSKVVTKIRTTDDNKVQFYYDASANNNIRVIMSGPLSIVTPSDEITLDTATHTTVSEITL